jgi:hypothetical protein
LPATPDVRFADVFVWLTSAKFSVRASVRGLCHALLFAMTEFNASSDAADKPGMIEDRPSFDVDI